MPGYTIRTAANLYAVRIKSHGATAGTNGAANTVSAMFGATSSVIVFPPFSVVGSTAVFVAVAAGGTQTVVLGTALETDTALAMGKIDPILRALGTALETDIGQPLGRRKTRAVGTALETDEGQPLGRVHQRTLGTALETDIGQPLGRRKTRAVGFGDETDTGQPVGGVKYRVLGFGAETDDALAMGKIDPILRALGIALETDEGQPLGRRKTLTLGVALETDEAVGLGRIHQITLGVAPEDDVGLLLGRIKRQWINYGEETDTGVQLGGSDPVYVRLILPVRRATKIGRDPHAYKEKLYEYVDRVAPTYSIAVINGVAQRITLPPSDLDADTLFLGGHDYTLTDDDPLIPTLMAAGCTVEAL